MEKQKIFSKKALKALDERRIAGTGEEYMRAEPFAVVGFEELESPDIDNPNGLSARVVPDKSDPDRDFKTAVAIFEAFPRLNRLQASDPGLWTHLTHVELWDYMRKRFRLHESDVEKRMKRIKNKWFLQEPSQSSLIHHPLAGLWWGVWLSVAPERGEEHKYDLTRILYRNLDLPTRTLGTYELGRLPAAVKGTLGYVFDHPDLFKDEYEAKMRAIMRLLNSIGGVLQLGCLDESFFREQIEANQNCWIYAKKTKKDHDLDEDSEDEE